MSNYQDFLASKYVAAKPTGFPVTPEAVNPHLFAFQRDIVRRACHLGKSAIFSRVGTGKTRMQLAFADLVCKHTGGRALILAPLAVAPQTVAEGAKIGIAVKHCHNMDEIGAARIVITNYDRADKFDATYFDCAILDESSILKHYSKTFFGLTAQFKHTQYKLACTATPSPNDIVELGNHSTFLDVMDFHDMLARFFVGEGDVARKARLRKWGETDFWQWVTSWAVCISHPRDMGAQYDMPGYDLPALLINERRLGVDDATLERTQAEGKLLPDANSNATTFHKIKRESIASRVAEVKAIVDSLPADEPVIVWCDRNDEADALIAALPVDFVEVRGDQPEHVKEERLMAFSNGKARGIISKVSIAGYGLNWQHCSRMIFAGVTFSFEDMYQAIGRIHRFGQTRECHVYLVYTEAEGNVRQILEHKQQEFSTMQANMTVAMQAHGLFREGSPVATFTETEEARAAGNGWTMHLGDCVTTMERAYANDSVDLTVTSIPFGEMLYTYSDKQADMGNCESREQFMEHLGFMIRELYRITRPGRLACVHVKDLPMFINRDGAQGIDPFTDDTSAAFRRAGWVLQSRITVQKDPVLEMQKTNSHGLLYMNWRVNAEVLRTGLPDYVLVFRKFPRAEDAHLQVPIIHDPRDTTYYGENPPQMMLDLPGRKSGKCNVNLPVWQEYASPVWTDVGVPCPPNVWMDIQQGKTLNYMAAKDNRDERHICPLQLDLIERLIHWYTNPGEVVFDPYGGIGSTPVSALKLGRIGEAVELKPSYHKIAVKHLKAAEVANGQLRLEMVI